MPNRVQHSIKRMFVIFFSVLMIVISVSPAFAEEVASIQLTDENIVESPTLDGVLYYGQKISEALTIVDGLVTIDGEKSGEVVAGHFEFADPDLIPEILGSNKIFVKFIPDDETLYTGFEMQQPLYTDVQGIPMELVDPSALPTATIKPSASGTITLSKYDITGVALKSVLTGEEVSVTWGWDKKMTKVTQSGYYLAKATATGYVNYQIYVFVQAPGDEDAQPPIKKFPTIESVTYYDGLKAGDLTLVGAEADNGEFTIDNPEQELVAGNNAITVVFTPNDGSQSVNIILNVKVAKATASFIDENGDTTVPKLTWTLGTKYNLTNLFSQLEKMKANCGTFKVGAITIDGIKPDGSIFVATEYRDDGYTATATLKSQENTSYTNTLKFKIVIEKKTVTPRISTYYFDTNEELIINGLSYTDKLAGTFKVYENGKLIESTKDGVKYLTTFDWRPEKSGTYTIKAEYTPSDDDICAIENNVIEQDVTVALKWTVNGENVNFTSTTKKYGETVTVLQSLGDNFGGWEFYDENGNKYADPEKELGMEYNPNIPSTVTFVMPDHDVKVKAIDNTQAELPGGDSNLPDFFSKIINWINNLIAKLKGLFDAIKQLVSAVV